MKKALCLVLVSILLFLCLPMSIFAEETEKYGTYLIDDSFEGLFLSESLIYSGMEVQNVDDEYLRLSISKTDSSVAFECEAERGGIFSNKIKWIY